MDALTLQNGPTAAQQAMDRIRTELGESVANCVAHHQTLAQREMTLRAMAVIEEMINDTSTFLYAQGRQHILQQAMEDGSSVVCSKCGDMVKAERWSQHSTMWCRAIDEIDDNMDENKMDS
jgi:formamidopyrimidine-DNA glycosylase